MTDHSDHPAHGNGLVPRLPRRFQRVRRNARRRFASRRRRPEPWTISSRNPPSSSRFWGLGSPATGASCGRVRQRKPTITTTSARMRVERRMTLMATAPSRRAAHVPAARYHQKRTNPRAPGLVSPRAVPRCKDARGSHARFPVRLFGSRQLSGQLAFREPSRKTVVSKWYPQLSQVHKCRTHRSFTCSDQSGAINASPHCAQGLKYLGRADRGLVAVSRDISKPPKIAAPILRGP
jgi:hypothetical protein